MVWVIPKLDKSTTGKIAVERTVAYLLHNTSTHALAWNKTLGIPAAAWSGNISTEYWCDRIGYIYIIYI